MNPIKAEIGLREKWVLQRDLHIYLPYLVILPKAILGTTLQMYRDDNSMVFNGRHSEEKKIISLMLQNYNFIIIAIAGLSIALSVNLIPSVSQKDLETCKTDDLET